VPRLSKGAIEELLNRGRKLIGSKISWWSIFVYNILDVYFYSRWFITGDHSGITNRATLAFPHTDKDIFEEDKEDKYDQHKLLPPPPVYLLWFHGNRPKQGKIDPLNPEQHLSSIFWSPLASAFAHSPVYYLNCLNDLYYQYRNTQDTIKMYRNR